jgi:hypothetical protein
MDETRKAIMILAAAVMILGCSVMVLTVIYLTHTH